MENVLSHRLAQFEVSVVHEDDTLLVLNKPPSFLVLPDRFRAEIPNLYSLLNDEYGKIFVVHRLDKETSGIIVFAKSADAHAHLSEQFTRHTVQKSYRAIVNGKLPAEKGKIELPIGQGLHGKMKIDHQHGKPSLTEYCVLEQFQGYSFVEASPRTGRTHQIRLHLSALGTPIVCDELYGGGKDFFLSSIKPHYKVSGDGERPLLQRTALHAVSISFVHPEKNEFVSFETPLPVEMELALKYLRKFRGRE